MNIPVATTFPIAVLILFLAIAVVIVFLAILTVKNLTGSQGASMKLNIEWSINLIRSLEWKCFEQLCIGYYQYKGFKPKVTMQGADGGIDISLYRDSFSLTSPMSIVQCKAWNTYKVGVKPVRELFGVMAAEEVESGIFVTSGEFTRPAIKFSIGKKLKLLTGNMLLNEILALPKENQQRLLKTITAGDYTTPSCPQCGIKMMFRTAGKGKDVGSQFWGCVNFPKCRQTFQFKGDASQ